MKKNVNLFELLINNENVNLYTRVILFIYNCNYYNRFYIPNQMIMNKFKINKFNSSRIINKLKDDNIIKIQFLNNKRMIKINNISIIDYNTKKSMINCNTFNYDYLNED